MVFPVSHEGMPWENHRYDITLDIIFLLYSVPRCVEYEDLKNIEKYSVQGNIRLYDTSLLTFFQQILFSLQY